MFFIMWDNIKTSLIKNCCQTENRMYNENVTTWCNRFHKIFLHIHANVCQKSSDFSKK